MKISFHVILTLAVVYAATLLINAFAFVLTDFSDIMKGVGAFFGRILAILSPLVYGGIIAYLLDPLVDFFQKHFYKLHGKEIFMQLASRLRGMMRFGDAKRYRDTRRSGRPGRTDSVKRFARTGDAVSAGGTGPFGGTEHSDRLAGAALTYMSIVLLIAVAAAAIVMKMGGSGDIMQQIAQTATRTANDFTDTLVKIEIRLAEWGVLDYVSTYLNDFINDIGALVKQTGNNLINSVSLAGNSIMNFFLGLVVAFYILKDKHKLKQKTFELMNMFLPKRINSFVVNLAGDINAIFSGYIRGQLTDAFIMAVLISLWLSIINVNFAVIIGIFSGISNIIPYFGAIIAFTLSVTVALFSSDPIKALYAAIGILILQQIDGMFIVPRVVGKNVKLGPVFVLLSLSIAGQLFGILGMVLAVPVCAILKMLIVRFLDRHESKKIKPQT